MDNPNSRTKGEKTKISHELENHNSAGRSAEPRVCNTLEHFPRTSNTPEHYPRSDRYSTENGMDTGSQEENSDVIGAHNQPQQLRRSDLYSERVTGDDESGCRNRRHTEQYMNLRNKVNRKPIQECCRQKRQTARDMSRPLKQWLYGHRDSPYPSKQEKNELAERSHMSLVQVSNWFANARRRLKNTVGGTDLTWARRIKLYNSNVVGNQELLSISSEDSTWDDNDPMDEADEQQEKPAVNLSGKQQRQVFSAAATTEHQSTSSDHSLIRSNPYLTSILTRSHDDDVNDDVTPAKYKSGILQRYLNDSYRHAMQVNRSHTVNVDDNRHRNPSGSVSSHDYEELQSISSRSTPTREHHTSEDDSDELIRNQSLKQGIHDDTYWKEITAALALTTLARSKINSTKNTSYH